MPPSSPARAIFLFEDDPNLAREIVAAFADMGLHVDHLASEEALRSCVHAAGSDRVLVMDRMVEGRDSLDVLAEMRARGARIPVVVISSLSSVDDRIRGLKAGGDDYLVKPFAMGELLARVEALHRRTIEDRSTRLAVGDLEMDLIARTVRRGGRDIQLQPREFGLLEYLMRNAGQVVTRAMLLEDVWHYRAAVETNVVDVHIGNLRRKIDGHGDPRLIVSVRGLGFRLLDDGGMPS